MYIILFVVMFVAALVPNADAAVTNIKETQPLYTTFQTGGGYQPDHDIKTDAVICYSDDAGRIKSWAGKGYFVQTMYGFRTGEDYIKDHAHEGQTARDGVILTCGPGSYYMVPTRSRIEAAVRFFDNAIDRGSMAVCPEEPEFFTFAGYSDSFKKAWQEYYKEPWQDQESSIEARWKSERLKAKMEYDMVKAIVDAAAARKRSVRRMVACHSAVNYYGWNIVYPHYECMMLPNLQEIIGQVWTGTARTPNKYEGKVEERTFETAFLEYSSLYNLARETGKKMWFLMDPLEDNQDRTMEDYHSNYEKTLVASLLFPEVDAYEVMPWPNRIYGRIPGDFATQISSIINTLQDMHNHKTVQYDMGTRGIATFVADSMGWQRATPHASNYDSFWGMTLPLVYKGIPIQVAQLERVVEKDYLKPYKVLLLTFDLMKPMKPEINAALAEWVKAGGVLVLFGGEDPYNALPEWWTKRGIASPTADLLSRLQDSGKGRVIAIKEAPAVYAESAAGAEKLRNIVKSACQAASLEYKENNALGIRRGDYVAIRVFSGQKKLTGSYINILDPKLPVVVDPVIPAGKCALYKDVSEQLGGQVKILHTSCRVDNIITKGKTVNIVLSGPQDTRGVVRVFTPMGCINDMASISLNSKKIDLKELSTSGVISDESNNDLKVQFDGFTSLISFNNEPESITLSIVWR